MKHIFFWSCSLLAFFQLNGTTWYVATSGNDNNSGNLSSPFKSINHALEVAEAGDIIELRGGTYPSNEIRIIKNNLTIRSYFGEWAIIEAPLDVEDIASCIWYSEPDVEGGTLENLEIKGGYLYGVSFETNWDYGLPDNERHGASNITIKNCKIHHTGRDCIKIKPECNGIQIVSCELSYSGIGPSNDPNGPNAEGIDNVNGDKMLVQNCYIHNTSTTGVYAKGGASECMIEGNLLMNTGEAGILLGFYTDAEFFDLNANPSYYECLNSTARNNIIINTGGAGIGLFAAYNCFAYNNTVATASPLFHSPLFCATGEIWINENLTIHPANQNIQVFNNIFVDESGNGDEDFTAQIREGALIGNNIFNYNIYFKKNGGLATFDDGVSWPALIFSQWQSNLGLDLQSNEIDPKLNVQYHLENNSPCVDKGQNTPGIITDYDGNLRSGLIDIGADEFGNGNSLQIPPPIGIIGTGANVSITATSNPNSGHKFEIYPNPVQNYLHIKNSTPKTELILMDMKGVELIKTNGDNLNLSSCPSGNFILIIKDQSHSEYHRITLTH